MVNEEHGRATALHRLRVASAVLVVVASGLLVCGYIGLTKYPNTWRFGPPYYLGGFIAGGLGLVQALLAAYIGFTATDFTRNEERKRQITCLMTLLFMQSKIVPIGCLASIVVGATALLGLSGSGKEGMEYRKTVMMILVGIVAGCLMTMFATSSFVNTIRDYGKHFNVRITLRQRRVNSTPIFSTDGNMFTGRTPVAVMTQNGVQLIAYDDRNRLDVSNIPQPRPYGQYSNQLSTQYGMVQGAPIVFNNQTSTSPAPEAYSTYPTAPPPSHDSVK